MTMNREVEVVVAEGSFWPKKILNPKLWKILFPSLGKCLSIALQNPPS